MLNDWRFGRISMSVAREFHVLAKYTYIYFSRVFGVNSVLEMELVNQIRRSGGFFGDL